MLPYGGVVLPYGYAYSKAKEPGGCRTYSKAAPVPTAVSSLRLCRHPMCVLPCVRASLRLCRHPMCVPLCRPYGGVVRAAVSCLCPYGCVVLPCGYVEPMCVLPYVRVVRAAMPNLCRTCGYVEAAPTAVSSLRLCRTYAATLCACRTYVRVSLPLCRPYVRVVPTCVSSLRLCRPCQRSR